MATVVIPRKPIKIELKSEVAPNKVDIEKLPTIEELEPEVEQELDIDKNIKIEDPVAAVMESPIAPWIFQQFPSNFIPYDGKRFFVKPLNATQLSRLHTVLRSNSPDKFSNMLNILNSYIYGIDIRDLTPGDFNAFLYWLRINSYPKSSYTLKVKSKYLREENLFKIRMTKSEKEAHIKRVARLGQSTNDHNYYDLSIKTLDMNALEYKAWKERGIRFPTVRDMELIKDSNIPNDYKYMANFAQYIIADVKSAETYLEDHLNALDAKDDLSILEEIDEFARKISHGVIEKIYFKISANIFNPSDYHTMLNEQRDIFHEIVTKSLANEDISEEEKLNIAILTASIAELNTEIDKINNHILNGDNFEFDEEEVEISINLDSFFPLL